MREWMRIWGKKNCLILAVLCLVNVGLFFLCADDGKMITSDGEILEEYLAEYPVFLDKTVAQGNKLAKLPVYKSGFAADQLHKTTECYEKLKGISVQPADNRGLVLLFSNSVTDIFFVAFLFLVVMDFFAENKKGLVRMVRSTVYGRGSLFAKRVAILAGVTMAAVCLFYGSSFVCAAVTLGINGLSRSIQSLPEYRNCPFRISIAQYYILVTTMKAMGGFILCMLIYTVRGCFGKITAGIILVLAGIGECAAAFFITPVSSLRTLKYVNIVSLLTADQYFKECIFLNVFNRAVPAPIVMVGVWGILIVLCTIVGAIIYGRRYVDQGLAGERILEWFERLKERFAPAHTLFGWEFYKLYIRQGALAILIFFVMLQWIMSFQYEYYYPVDAMEKLYYIKYHGEITEKMVEDVEYERNKLLNAERYYEELLVTIEQRVPFNSEHYMGAQEKLKETQYIQEGFLPVYEAVQGAYAYGQENNRPIWLIEPYVYDLLIHRDNQTRNRAAFLEIMTIVAALGGIYAFENKNHMSQISNTAYRGKRLYRVIKPVHIVLFSMITAVLLHGVQLYHIGKTMGFSDLSAPVGSIPFLRDIRCDISIGTYLILMMLFRALMAVVFGLIIAGISIFASDRFVPMGIGAMAVLFLVVIAKLIPGMQWIDPLSLLGVILR